MSEPAAQNFTQQNKVCRAAVAGLFSAALNKKTKALWDSEECSGFCENRSINFTIISSKTLRESIIMYMQVSMKQAKHFDLDVRTCRKEA